MITRQVSDISLKIPKKATLKLTKSLNLEEKDKSKKKWVLMNTKKTQMHNSSNLNLNLKFIGLIKHGRIAYATKVTF